MPVHVQPAAADRATMAELRDSAATSAGVQRATGRSGRLRATIAPDPSRCLEYRVASRLRCQALLRVGGRSMGTPRNFHAADLLHPTAAALRLP